MLKGAGSPGFVCAVVGYRAQGISAGTGAESEVSGGGSVGCRLSLHSGLGGGLRMEKQDALSSSVLAVLCTGVAPPCWFCGDPRCPQLISGGPAFILSAREKPAGGNLTWRLSDGSDGCPLDAAG